MYRALSRHSLRHRYVLRPRCQEPEGEALRAGGAVLTAARDVAEFPAFAGIGGETPWPGLPVRVATVIHLQVLAWKSESGQEGF